MSGEKEEDTDTKLADAAVRYIEKAQPDFLFLHLGETDMVGGHGCGWMSPGYLESVRKAVGCVERIRGALTHEDTLILLADHGGHDRSHGSELPEDMTIPIFLWGPTYAQGREMTGLSIKDLAVTVAHLLDVPAVKEWEGTLIS